MELAEKLDVADLLPQLTAPTLVLHRRQVDSPELSAARELASTIPNAQLTLLDGDSCQPRLGDGAAVGAAVGELSREAEEAEPAAAPRVAGGFATILFTDMAASTTLADRLGDAAAQEVRRAHNEIVRGALAANGGNEIKHTGDGIMASFGTASAALDAAIAIQRGVAEHKEERPDSPLGVYVGLNAGEPIAEEGDLFGTSINPAARICDHAEAGQVLASHPPVDAGAPLGGVPGRAAIVDVEYSVPARREELVELVLPVVRRPVVVNVVQVSRSVHEDDRSPCGSAPRSSGR